MSTAVWIAVDVAFIAMFIVYMRLSHRTTRRALALANGFKDQAFRFQGERDAIKRQYLAMEQIALVQQRVLRDLGYDLAIDAGTPGQLNVTIRERVAVDAPEHESVH